MLELNIQNETAQLEAVILGQPESLGITPDAEQTYDAKSYESVLKNIYPEESDIEREMFAFEKILLKYDVKVFRPSVLKNCNQIFSRDVGVVIDDKMILCNIIPDRKDEQEAYFPIFNRIAPNKIYNLPEDAHLEGGDIILNKNFIFVGIYTKADYSSIRTARTNIHALNFLKLIFPKKEFIPIELIKNDKDPRKGILHLDCTFMELGNNKAIIYKDGFQNSSDYYKIVDIYGTENIFEISTEEMYTMNTNIFSISPQVVVSDASFSRLNRHLEDKWNIRVEMVPYQETAKMGGLLRCSTLPLIRKN